MDDPLCDLDKRVAGYEVEAILFTRAQLFRGPGRQKERSRSGFFFIRDSEAQ
jgi:hypothetical protein